MNAGRYLASGVIVTGLALAGAGFGSAIAQAAPAAPEKPWQNWDPSPGPKPGEWNAHQGFPKWAPPPPYVYKPGKYDAPCLTGPFGFVRVC